MPSRSRRSSRGRFDFNRFVPFLQVLLMLSVFSNFIIVFLFERDRTPRVVRQLETVTTNHLIVVTNFISSVGSTNSVLRSKKQQEDDNSISIPYHYFMRDGYPCFRLYGRNYSIGSPTSHGRVVDVFPDRVRLDNGLWLVNSSPYVEVFGQSKNQDLKKSLKENKKNDGIRNK